MNRGAAVACALLAALTFLGPRAEAAPAVPVRSVMVEGTQFRLTLADGRVLAQEALPGTILAIGDGTGRQRRLRIDTVERDARNPAGEVVLYALSEQDPASGEWHNACQADPDGRRLGFPLAGAFTPDTRYMAEPGRLLITCTGGAEGKCVRFGYKPWRRLPDGTSLAPYFQTCVRLVRADYAGDGVGHTRDGTPIDIFDRIGLRSDEPAPGMTLEAAWGPDGAVCVRHTRFPDQPPLDALARLAPRLRGHLGENCGETAPGLLFNRSFGH